MLCATKVIRHICGTACKAHLTRALLACVGCGLVQEKREAKEDSALRARVLAICADENPPLVCQSVFGCVCFYAYLYMAHCCVRVRVSLRLLVHGTRLCLLSVLVAPTDVWCCEERFVCMRTRNIRAVLAWLVFFLYHPLCASLLCGSGRRIPRLAATMRWSIAEQLIVVTCVPFYRLACVLFYVWLLAYALHLVYIWLASGLQ